MEMDGDHEDKDLNRHTRGTIKALFYNMHSKGARPMNFQGRRNTNGGGSNPTAKVLKTTMKKTSTSRKKMGTSAIRGAKSRNKGKPLKLTGELKTDSSQKEIGHYFFKLGGIIGTGSDKICGRIPLGEARIPLKTRGIK